MKMNPRNNTYGRKLIEAAISGISKREAPGTHKSPAGLVVKCLSGAVLATWVETQVFKRSNRLSRTTACAAIGFLAALAWNTRQITGAMARSAAREVAKARDEHWLEMNPINYA